MMGQEKGTLSKLLEVHQVSIMVMGHACGEGSRDSGVAGGVRVAQQASATL